jgi:hypothetical protein
MSSPYLTIIDEARHQKVDDPKKMHWKKIKKERKYVDDRRI